MKNNIKSFWIFICVMLITVSMTAQNKKTLTGRVIDSTGELVIGATVLETGTSNGTITSIEGTYSIQVSDKAKSLTLSYIGYKTKIIEIGKSSTINVTMEVDALNLDEVVVVGYGSMKKSDLTGAVSSVKPEELPQAATTTVAQMMKGQVSGVSFTQSSSQPGAKVKMQIRGAAAGAFLISSRSICVYFSSSAVPRRILFVIPAYKGVTRSEGTYLSARIC